jgi:hypothetical protein
MGACGQADQDRNFLAGCEFVGDGMRETKSSKHWKPIAGAIASRVLTLRLAKVCPAAPGMRGILRLGRSRRGTAAVVAHRWHMASPAARQIALSEPDREMFRNAQRAQD